MQSQLKSDTARANGAKPRGPKSAETREKSSRNSLKHGGASRHTMLLACEDQALFQRIHRHSQQMFLELRRAQAAGLLAQPPAPIAPEPPVPAPGDFQPFGNQ